MEETHDLCKEWYGMYQVYIQCFNVFIREYDLRANHRMWSFSFITIRELFLLPWNLEETLKKSYQQTLRDQSRNIT